jgi:hypothetical protein
MRLMKRVLKLIQVAVMAFLVLAPLGVQVTDHSLRVVPSAVYAVGCTPMPAGNICCNNQATIPDANGACPVDMLGKGDPCVSIALKINSGDSLGKDKNGKPCVDNTSNGGAIIVYLIFILKLLGGAVGIVIVLMLVIAGIQYITSVGDPGRIKAAKDRIVGAMTALLLFVTMFAILNFLVPGGILK